MDSMGHKDDLLFKEYNNLEETFFGKYPADPWQLDPVVDPSLTPCESPIASPRALRGL